jgi:predicted anti-sigma-YlaC factor YlaD
MTSGSDTTNPDLEAPETPSRRLQVSATLAAIGGSAALLQAIVAWTTVDVGRVLSVGTNGADYRGGQVIMLAGAAVLALAVAMAMRSSIPAAAIIASLGLLITVVAIINFPSLSNELSDFAALQQAANGTTASTEHFGPGLFIALVGGAFAAVGGILGSRQAPD